jgi:hypothetical protein
LSDGASNHVEREVGLGLKADLVGNPCFVSPTRIVRPRLGQVQLEVDGEMLGPGRDAEADADLAIGDLASGPGVLPLHAHRMGPLLEKTGVVDDPGLDRLGARQGIDAVSHRFATDIPIAPRRVVGEVDQSLVGRMCSVPRKTRQKRAQESGYLSASSPYYAAAA